MSQTHSKPFTPLSFVLDSIRPGCLGPQSRSAVLPENPSEFFQSQEDWEHIFDLSEKLKVGLPFLLSVNQSPWKGDLSGHLLNQINQKLRTAIKSLAQVDHESEMAIRHLVKDGIPLILLGPADSARRFYPERAYRPTETIEILVPKEFLSHALRSLGRGGYRLSRLQSALSGNGNVLLQRRLDTPLLILKTTLIKSSQENFESKVWERSQDNLLFGLPKVVRVLSLEDSFLYSVRQMVSDGLFSSPIFLNDLHFMISSPFPLDWEILLPELEGQSLLKSTYFVLKLLEQDWGTEVSKDALLKLKKKVSFLHSQLAGRYQSVDDWFSAWNQNLPRAIRQQILGIGFQENAPPQKISSPKPEVHESSFLFHEL